MILLRAVPAIVWVLLALILSGFLLVRQIQTNAVLQEQVETAQQEKTDAEAEKTRAIEATRVAARQLAEAREAANRTSRALASVPDDDCLSRDLPAGAVAALRLQPEGRKAKPAGTGGPAPDAEVQRQDVPGRAAAHP